MKHALFFFVALFVTNIAVRAQVTVSTLAGTGYEGDEDGIGSVASFYNPASVAVDGNGNVYVADVNNNKIRKITPAGVVTTLAGSGSEGSQDDTGSDASFYGSIGVAVDGSGNVYVADVYNHKIRKITPAGVVTTLAGSGSSDSQDGTGSDASFYNPMGVAVDGSGNVYVADYYNHKIRKVTAAGVVSTLAGSGSLGSADGTGTAASFAYPQGVAVDGSGNVYVADTYNHKIRKITPSGDVTTLAGSGSSGRADDIGTSASFSYPQGVAVDGSGNVYVADANNNKIRKITPAGLVTTLAGSGTEGNIDDTGDVARFSYPQGVAVDGSGNVYVADTYNNTIRKIKPTTLPVMLTNFTAKADGNYAKLQWQTASEVNNKGFEIWRGAESEKQKAESTTFVKIGEVSASHISNLASQIYNYTDKSPLNGNNYYKLVQVDNDGKTTELGIKTVTFNFQPTTFNLYPNPATHNITLNLGNKKGTLTITDALGRAKTTLSYHASAITIDISAYPSGVYFYQLGNVKGKFIKQ